MTDKSLENFRREWTDSEKMEALKAGDGGSVGEWAAAEIERLRAAMQEALDAYETHEDHRIAPALTKGLKV